MDTKETLQKAKEALDSAIEKARNKRNEEDRRFIVASIGQDLVKILEPLLGQIASNTKITKEEMKDIIKEIKIESPKVNIEPAQIKVDAPKIPQISIPKIEFPKEELIKAIKEAFLKVKFPKAEVKSLPFPKEIKVAEIKELVENIEKLATAKLSVEMSGFKFDRDNPLPVILTDENGKFYKAMARLVSEGGGAGIGSLKQIEGRLQVDVISMPTVAVTNAGVFAVQIDGAALTALQLIDDAVSGAGFNITQLNGATVPIGAGLEATAVRVTLPTDGTGLVTAKQATAANLNMTEASASAIKTAVEVIDNAISGTEMQVDVVAALPAGTNAIGKLLPPDIDITTHTNYIKKYYTSAGAVTDGIVWSPAAGKRWHAVTLYINVSAAATVTLEDDLAAGDSAVWKAELAANSGVVIKFGEKYPLASGEDAADLIITTSAGNVYVTVVGYEI